MNRKEFLSLLVFSLLGTKVKAQYSDSNSNNEELSREKSMTYILLNLYESPPRWLYDLPLKANGEEITSSPMISTKFQNGTPAYQTVDVSGIQMPSLWENNISTISGNQVPLSKLFDNMVIIRGCNMSRDGHDLNSRILEASSAGETSLGGIISDAYPSSFPALAINGVMADPYKNAVSSFTTKNGLKAFICKEDSRLNNIQQVLDLYKSESHHGDQAHTILKKIGDIVGDTDPTSYKKIKELQGLPFEDIYNTYNKSLKKYSNLIKRSWEKDKIKGVDGQIVKGISFPAKFELNNEKSTNPLDYMGAYQFDQKILTERNINNIFDKASLSSLAERFALAETSMLHDLTNVLILNIDPLEKVHLTNAVPVKDISHTIESNVIIFDCPREKRISSSHHGEKMTFDAHFIGTIPGLIGYSKVYMLLSSCLFEFKNFLKENKRNEKNLFDNTLIHLTSEFERAPQKNQAGSDHGWEGHTSTLISGRFNGVHLIGSIEKLSDNAMKNYPCTWGGAATYPPIGRHLRYGDIVNSIATVFKTASPQGGESLLRWKDDKVIPRFKKGRDS